MVVESVEPGCSFTKFFYVTSTRKDEKKQTKHDFLLEKDEFVTRQTNVRCGPFSEQEHTSTNHSHRYQKMLKCVQKWKNVSVSYWLMI